jgi:hypothetical protein
LLCRNVAMPPVHALDSKSTAESNEKGAVPMLSGRAPATFDAICGYATNTDWTASAPILRHSGYCHHHQERDQS